MKPVARIFLEPVSCLRLLGPLAPQDSSQQNICLALTRIPSYELQNTLARLVEVLRSLHPYAWRYCISDPESFEACCTMMALPQHFA